MGPMEDEGKPKILGSAYDDPTFGEDSSFHIDQPVGSMSISPCGRDVVLGSKEGLHIIDLDSPYSPPRYLPHHTSWEVADVQWSPFASRDTWVISTSNQKALVWNLAMPSPQDSIEFVLHGHTRAITDINFSAHDPNKLATCAVDSFVHCWDLRTPARPVISFSDWFAGATQVKWNRQDQHVIASSHDRSLHIWDERKGAYPMRSIEAHSTKIYGIDWNRQDRNLIVTCSLDKSIKLWDYEMVEDVPQRTIETGFPVWRARHTPFGDGILAMPQRGNYNLHLYDRKPTKDWQAEAPPAVARFPGHKAQVKEFLWRPKGLIHEGVDFRDFQLVTWGADRELRLHRVMPETMSAIGYERGHSKISRLNITRRGAKYRTFRDEPTDGRVAKMCDGELHRSSPVVPPTEVHTFQQRRAPSTGMSKIGIPQGHGWAHSPGFGSRIGMHGRTNLRQDMNPITWMKNVKISSWESETLGEEIAHVGQKFARVSFEAVDMQRRRSTISMHGPWAQEHSSMFMKIDIYFPRDYPRATSPVFSIQKTASMTDELSVSIQLDLNQIAEAYVNRKRGCLEAILRYLLREQTAEEIISWILKEPVDTSGLLDGDHLDEDLSSDEDDEAVGDFQGQPELNSSELLNANVLVPVPKACGALWADNGKLVCFFPPKRNEPASFLDSLDLGDTDRSRGARVFERFGRLQASSPGPRSALRAGMTVDDDDDDDVESELSDTSSNSSSTSSGSSDVLASLPTGFLPPNAWRGSNFGLQRSRSADQSQRSTNGKQTISSNGQSPPNVISIHNMEDLLPSKRELALEYRLFGEGSDVCTHNSAVAEKFGNKQIARAWEVLALVLQRSVVLDSVTGPDSEQLTVFKVESPLQKLRRHDSGVDLASDSKNRGLESPHVQTRIRIRWGPSPITSQTMIPDIFHYFERLGDTQTLAMLSCVLHKPSLDGPLERAALRFGGFSNDQSVPRSNLDDRYHSDATKTMSMSRSNRSLVRIGPLANKAPVVIATTTNSTASSAERTGPLVIPTMFSTQNSPPVRNTSAESQEWPLPAPALHARVGNRKASDSRERDRLLKSHTQSISLSSSPSDSRPVQHSTSNLAFSFSRASLSNLVQTYSHSPPGNSRPVIKKQPSPSSSFAGTSWMTESAPDNRDRGGEEIKNSFARSFNASHRSERQISPSFPRVSRFEDRPAISKSYPNTFEAEDWFAETKDVSRNALLGSRNPQALTQPSSNDAISGRRRSYQVQTVVHNIEKFDHGDGAGPLPTALLNPNLDWKYHAYRAQYAHLLGVWGLDVHRQDILKFNHSDSSGLESEDREDTFRKSDGLGMGALRSSAGYLRSTSSKSRAVEAMASGLRLQKHCLLCGESLSPVLKNGRTIAWSPCVKCAHPGRGLISAKRAICSICHRVIQGLLIPCLNCGHASCFDCTVAWFGGSAGEEETGVRECPAACGCICPRHRVVQPPWPDSPSFLIQQNLPKVNVLVPAAVSTAPAVEPAVERLQRVSLVRSKSNLGSVASIQKGARSRSRSHTTRSNLSLVSGHAVERDDDEDEDEDGLELGAGFGPAAPETRRNIWPSERHETASFSELRAT